MGQDKGVSSLRAAARDCVKEGRHTEVVPQIDSSV